MPLQLYDSSAVAKLDKRGLFKLQLDWPDVFQAQWRRVQRLDIEQPEPPRSIVVCGMGGSGICGDLLSSWIGQEYGMPVCVWKDYGLPKHIGREDLLVAISHSGNTEETLNSFAEAMRRKIPSIAITSGGKLQAEANKHSAPSVRVPKIGPPRAALPHLFVALVGVVNKANIIRNADREFLEVESTLRELRDGFAPTCATRHNDAKRAAINLRDHVPVVYASNTFGAVAYRMKTVFNENSKYPAKVEILPELKHNEVVGWEVAKRLSGNFVVLLLRDHLESEDHGKDFDLVKRLVLRRQKVPFLETWSKGNGMLSRMFSLVYWGDFVSLYLAVLNGRDPGVTRTIDLLKAAERIGHEGDL